MIIVDALVDYIAAALALLRNLNGSAKVIDDVVVLEIGDAADAGAQLRPTARDIPDFVGDNLRRQAGDRRGGLQGPVPMVEKDHAPLISAAEMIDRLSGARNQSLRLLAKAVEAI
jgi:hypothetical protein